MLGHQYDGNCERIFISLLPVTTSSRPSYTRIGPRPDGLLSKPSNPDEQGREDVDLLRGNSNRATLRSQYSECDAKRPDYDDDWIGFSAAKKKGIILA